MEEITWIIYKGLMALVGVMKNFRVIFSTIGVVVFAGSGWFLQNRYGVLVGDNADQLANVVVQSLITLVAFVGAMVIFGFETIRSKVEKTGEKIDKDKDEKQNLKEGWEIAKNKMMKFSVYTFFVVVLNLFLILFFKPYISTGKFTLAILFADIALVIYSFYLVIGLADKVLDVLKELLSERKNN